MAAEPFFLDEVIEELVDAGTYHDLAPLALSSGVPGNTAISSSDARCVADARYPAMANRRSVSAW